ncbi:transcription factor 20 [Labrus bergylta]|uniref:transcription factor 20 n=1 Tax=Labrus bergylta TaxID=56723 RepID=UPI0033136CE2
MEEPPGSVDDLQPQDLSTSSLPAVIDLTMGGEDCVLSPASLNSLRRVSRPALYHNSATSSPPPSGITLQPGDQIQPDNAFSHTTVTLSYVSRSHVYSTHDSLSFSVPPVSRLSLHPPCDPEKGPGETLNQHYVEQGEGPMDLAAQTLLQSLSQAQGGAGTEGGGYLTQRSREVNGGDITCGVDLDKHVEEEQRTCWGLENGRKDTWSGPLAGAESEQAVVHGSGGVRDLNGDYRSTLEDPVSPSPESVEEVFVMPHASCSPSGNNSYLETMKEAVRDGLRTGGAGTTGLESSDKNKPRQKVEMIDLTEDDSENQPQTVAHVNGNTKTLQRTLKGKKVSLRSGRGTRLESIVMNINSNRYEVSGCIRTNKKTPQSAVSDSELAQRTDGVSGGRKKRRASVSLSGKTKEAVSPRKRGQSVNSKNCKVSTSDSEIIKNSKQSHSPRFRNTKKEAELLSPPEPSGGNHVARSPTKPSGRPPPSSSKTPSPKKGRGKAAGQKASPAAKTPRRKRKKQHTPSFSPSSLFAPKEPEIKLKYVNFREERRELRVDTFSPYVRVERQPSSPSLCSVINYPEQVQPQHRKQKSHLTSFISAAIPSTSCLLLGRASTHGQHRRSLVCCLCGRSANTMDLGDLHGPYYPEGYQLGTKTKTSIKEDENGSSDSDSSSCNVRGRGRKCPSTQRPLSTHLKSPCWTGDSTGSPATKRARSAAGCADMEDWYSPPVLPLEPCEYWLHEDCGIWSAGVFLVRGRVYGLEEAVRAANETTCSACHHSGATLGCFFKGCPNNYHYRCALQSDCILIEENFSMKCKKHKNKTFKAPPGTRCDDR